MTLNSARRTYLNEEKSPMAFLFLKKRIKLPLPLLASRICTQLDTNKVRMIPVPDGRIQPEVMIFNTVSIQKLEQLQTERLSVLLLIGCNITWQRERIPRILGGGFRYRISVQGMVWYKDDQTSVSSL
jgi:hypothetical protein